MKIIEIPGTTRTVGVRQGYRGLPLRDVKVDCPVNGPNTPAMLMDWAPTPEEIKRLVDGGVIRVTILGETPPPHSLEVLSIEDATKL